MREFLLKLSQDIGKLKLTVENEELNRIHTEVLEYLKELDEREMIIILPVRLNKKQKAELESQARKKSKSQASLLRESFFEPKQESRVFTAPMYLPHPPPSMIVEEKPMKVLPVVVDPEKQAKQIDMRGCIEELEKVFQSGISVLKKMEYSQEELDYRKKLKDKSYIMTVLKQERLRGKK